ncbi:N-acetylmuramoyl-L-alanine amidase family protein [Sporosarcina limicola]|uniref:N-acetylmuramoyl-L-alanine amidase n=1 Tax=Sporosarcina limicola TaxID=34101 RepID=A0A927RCX6_9BACL|nr:N-acetylmuramoyl-L-alanine amidase [Sporosarcina limicola]MBE1554820.1 N-acetylmuramoyl-L-alanine amidase CwlA [Sporosarcina limicola]
MRLLKHGSKVGNATVIVDIIQKGNPEIRPGTSMKPKKITTHNTGNASKGANAKAHNTYIHNLASYHPKDTTHVSWHISVDDMCIYQHIPFDETAWHCGDGSGVNSGNRTSIGIEICENPETNTRQAEENAIALTVLLMKEFGVGSIDVVPHQHWSGKYCPRVILKRDESFTSYRNRVAAAFSAPKKEEDELKFSSPTLKSETETSLLSKAHRQIIVDAAVKAGAYSSWVDKLANGTLTDADVLGLAVKYTVAVNK